MNPYDGRLDELAGRGADGLAEVLRRRPEVLDPPPRTLDELASRLDHPAAVREFFRGQQLPVWQVFAAACSLDSMPLAEFRSRFEADPLPQLRVLHHAALLDLDEDDDVFSVPDEVAGHQPDPLHLGPNVVVVASQVPAEFVRAAARAFGCGPTSTGWDSVSALADAYLDGDRVRRALDGLDDEVVAVLQGIAAEYEVDPDLGIVPRHFPDLLLPAATAAGRQRGLVIGIEHSRDSMGVMPAEVRLALRGPGYRLPCTPEPAVAWLPLPLARADDDAAAAMRSFDAAATAVLDDIDRHGLVLLKIGGVGSRELKRLSKTTQLQDATVRLVLELARETRLLTGSGTRARTTEGYRAWRDAEPSERLVPLLRAWWRFPGRASESRNRYGERGQPWATFPCDDCRLEHVALLEILRPDAGISLDDAALLASWHHPAAHVGPEPYASAWGEAAELGVVAQGALSVVGVALRDGDDAGLVSACEEAMPLSTATAVFGSDLTALAVGSPSGRVSTVLDACADRESTGGAVTWRLSRESVRRALDDGWVAADLREALLEVAGDAALPPAVTVLLDDVERAYGRVVVRGATAVLVAEDELVAVELVHDRRLSPLGLTAVTATVLTSTAEPAKVVAALRKAGHLPRWQPPPPGEARAAGPVRVSSARPPLRTAPPRPAPAVDHLALAEQLLASPRHPVFVPDALADRPPFGEHGLSPGEVEALHTALATAGRVEIVYRDGQGSVTERVIRPMDLAGGLLEAFCELRSAERDFVVSRILAVRPV